MNDHERNRYQEYCQMRKEIRGSREYLIVGIDVAKDKHNAFFGTPVGRTLLKKLIFDNTVDGFTKLIQRTEALREQNGLDKIVFGLEPTGHYHKPLGQYLLKCGYQVVLVSGVAVARNRELLDGRWDKHDTKCAANVADLISQGKCQFYECPSEEIIELRYLLSLRERLKKEEHSLKMRIRNCLLAKHFPELDKFYARCETESLAIVRWCLAPNAIAGMEFDQFRKVVTTRDRGLPQQHRLYAIWSTAADSIGCPVGAVSEFEAEVLVEKLKQVRETVEAVDSLIAEICSCIPAYGYLLTIPGFGPYISALTVAVIGNPYRFSNTKQVIKLAGYDLSAHRSGKTSNTAVPVLSKKGNSRLRYALYQAAMVASTRNCHFIDYFTKVLSGRQREKGIKTKMRVKLAAKMLVIAWTIMKKQQPFDPGYLMKQ